MRKLLVFKDGSEYITGGIVAIEPNGVDPIEQYDLSALSGKEIKELMQKKKDKMLLKKARKL